MESAEIRGSEKKRRRRGFILAAAAVVLLLVILAVVLGVTLSGERKREEFKDTFMERCQKFKGYNCQHIWELFQQAYVNKDPCEVPPNAYDTLIAAAPMEPPCNTLLFWSKTKDVVQDFARKNKCFQAVEETLLGSVLNSLTWCGKKDSNETLTTGCPGWLECENNPPRSFWRRLSTAFGDAACGNATAMLNGSITTPFDSQSIFASVEVKRFKSPRVKNLNVVLVIQKNSVSNCSNPSLQNLVTVLDKGISYRCVEVPRSQIEECGDDPEKPCGPCW
ncbi:ADP-ribosyl cyclase/cyclic ADP-ribose hydrolase 1-like [Poecilia latipinna]|uniref:ADP-ribosyl cyclase/cyclic ADP-ribose hydrolase 1-like n=1 Tax=Poecilia latipinna TaxID=48699 RepID=UPI00072E8E32|nr:PREDICTED: ADP-ribosyl cyclase/cyclic ADP-ribose hydrolase 1-like [Poecilia latipinna]